MRHTRTTICCLAGLSLLLGRAHAAGLTVLGSLTRETTLSPGGSAEGRILVANNGEAKVQIKVYQTDYRFSADGTNSYGEAGHDPRSNARWITFSPQQLEILAGDTGSVDYRLQVPADDKLVGTYWSILMLEPLAPDSPELATGPDTQPKVRIRTVMRYGIQIVTQIGNTGQRKIEFADKRLLNRDGQRFLQVDVANTGERSLAPVVWTELYDHKGASIGRYDGQRSRIFPGCSVRYQIDLSQIPAAVYNALTVADNGDENVFGAQWKLDIK